MRRREFIAGLAGSATVLPLAAWAQQPTALVVGYLYAGSPEPVANYLAEFRKGLSQMGFVEGRNLAIEFRFAHNEISRLPELVADPVEMGLVAALNRPGRNVTGITQISTELGSKRLELLRELVPGARHIALLIDPNNPTADGAIKDTQAAAVAGGLQLEIVSARNNREIDAAFANLVKERIEALLVSPTTLFANRRIQLQSLAARHAMPTIYVDRADANAGGLMSYGPNIADTYRQVGIYTGRILKGEKPEDLPVARPTKFEFVVNLQTARTLGIEIPPTLLAIADEVIE